MKAATTSKRFYDETKLAVLREGARRVEHRTVADLISYFRDGDLLIVNTSGTLPSSFRAQTSDVRDVEIRLASFLGESVHDFTKWRAVLFGAGDWHQPTEARGEPPTLKPGDELKVSENLIAFVTRVDREHIRLVDVEFKSSNLLEELYRNGKPIQYSYLQEELHVWDQQTLFASAPISVEPPSASFPLTWRLLFELQKIGVKIAPVMHGAGLSSTGDASFDKRFPLDEYYEVPAQTIEAAQAAKRVIAIGTSACRAIESAARTKQLKGRTTLRIDALTDLHLTDALLTGMHEPETSHFDLMSAFGETEFLTRETNDYRSHEYGDLTLIFRAHRT